MRKRHLERQLGCRRGISASINAFTTEITARYSPRTLIEASFDRGLGDQMLLVSHVGREPASWGKGVRVFEMATLLFRRAWELTSTHATMVATMARKPETMSTKPSVAP